MDEEIRFKSLQQQSTVVIITWNDNVHVLERQFRIVLLCVVKHRDIVKYDFVTVLNRMFV